MPPGDKQSLLEDRVFVTSALTRLSTTNKDKALSTENEEYYLRRLQDKDKGRFSELLGDTRVSRYHLGLPPGEALSEAEMDQAVKDHAAFGVGAMNFGVFASENDTLVGFVGISGNTLPNNYGPTELSVALPFSDNVDDIGRQACTAIMKEFWNVPSIENGVSMPRFVLRSAEGSVIHPAQVLAVTSAANFTGRKLFKDLGFSHLGTLTEQGKVDTVCYGATREEFEGSLV